MEIIDWFNLRKAMKLANLAILALLLVTLESKLVFEDNFDFLDF